jgi:hypothetical protein
MFPRKPTPEEARKALGIAADVAAVLDVLLAFLTALGIVTP